MKKYILIKVLIFIIFIGTNIYGYETVETIFTRGLNYYIQREFKRAALEWKKVLDRMPTHSRAKVYMEKAYKKYNKMEINFYKGLDKFNLEKYREAIPYFKKTLMINPRHKKAIYYLNLCYKFLEKNLNKKQVAVETKKEADKYLEEEQFTQAVALYKITILLNPEDEDAKIKLISTQSKVAKENKNLELSLHLQAAREYHEKKEYLLAIQEWSKALLIAPDNLEAQNGLKKDKRLLELQRLQEKINELIAKGIDSFVNKKYYQAKDYFSAVLNLDSNNETAIEYLKKIEYELNILNKKNLARQEALRHLEMAKLYFKQKKYKDSLTEVNLTLDILKDNQEAIELKQKILEMLRKQKEQEMKNNAAMIQKLLQEGIKNYRFGEYEFAIDKFEEVLKLDPENKYAKEYLKMAREALLLQSQSEINDDSPYYLIVKNLEQQGLENLKIKNYNIALKYFKQILDLFPLNKRANILILKTLYKTAPVKVENILAEHYKNGLNYYNKKNYNKALYEFETVKEVNDKYKKVNKYIKLCKNPPSVNEKKLKRHYNKGLYYYSLGKYDEAIKEWQQVISIDKSPLSNKYLGQALSNISKAEFRKRLKGGKGISLAQVEKKSSANQRNIQKHYYMGVAYYTSGDYKNALKEWKMVLRLNPNHTLALKNIKKCQRRLKLKE